VRRNDVEKRMNAGIKIKTKKRKTKKLKGDLEFKEPKTAD
jgi:hypothetical protein